MQQLQECLLVNDMAAISKQLNLAYRQFITRAITEEELRAKILQILNSHYPESLVKPIINEIALRNQLRDQIFILLDSNDFKLLEDDQLVLDVNRRISVSQTIKQYYLEQLKERKSANLHVCAIFGLAELISEKNYEIFKDNFFSDDNRNLSLKVMFYLSALHGNLVFLQRVWELAESFGIEKELISNHNFEVVAAGRASNNLQINEFIMACARKTDVIADIPEFNDDQMFPLLARANNRHALLACLKHPREPAEYLSLLTNNNCKIFESIEGEGQEKMLDTLLNCLIVLSKTGKVSIPDDIWKMVFNIAVNKSSLSCVKKIWLELEDEALKKLLLNDAFVPACTIMHVPIMKFILEQSESFAVNPIEPWKIELAEATIPNGHLDQIGELFSHSPLISAVDTLKK